MKKYVFAVAGLLIVIMLTACIHNLTSNNPHTDWQGLHLYVAPGSVTPTGLRLSMINDSELNFGHGIEFRIEQYSGGRWRQVPFINDFAWALPLFHISPHTAVDENISWVHMHGELPPGQYRIVRNFIENDFTNPTPMWERDIAEADLYAIFMVEQDWQSKHELWQIEQYELAAVALARFEGLDLHLLEYSPRGLRFTLTNNNPNYRYHINSVFVGWEDTFPGGGFAGAMEYPIFSEWLPDNASWPFDNDKRLAPGESLSLEVDWYDEIGLLAPSVVRESLNPYLFDLTVDVTLDASEEYIAEHFRHIIPEVPTVSYRIRASFDLSP